MSAAARGWRKPWAGSGCTRFTMKATKGISLSTQPPVEVERLVQGQRRAGRPPARSRRRRGAAARARCAARSLNPAYIPSKARKNSERSCRNCRPSTRSASFRAKAPGARGDLQGQAAGHEVRLQEPAQDARCRGSPSAAPAPPGSRGRGAWAACRGRRGRSARPRRARAASPWPCTRGCPPARTRPAGRSGSRGCAAAPPRRGVCRSTRASNVRLVSRVMAHRRPRGRVGRDAVDVQRARLVGQAARGPRLVARRREGSMVQTSTRRPRSAARSAERGRGRRLARRRPSRTRRGSRRSARARGSAWQGRRAHAASSRSASACSDWSGRCRSSKRKGSGTSGASTAFFRRFR